MNWFILATVFLYLGGCVYEATAAKNSYLAVVYGAWAISNLALVLLGRTT